MAISDALRGRQLALSEVMIQHALVEATPEGGGHMSYAMSECIFSHWRIYACSSAGYVIRFWGMDKKGQPINSLLTCASARMARCAAAAALVELGSRAHFCIASLKDKALPRLVTEFKALSAIQQAAPAGHACSTTRR